MKKVSLFWCLGNLEAISFFSVFLTFTVQPPSVSRQRCHRNIRSGHCYLMKEGKTEREREVGAGAGAIVIKAQYYKNRRAIELTADSPVRRLKQNEARYRVLIGSGKRKKKKKVMQK